MNECLKEGIELLIIYDGFDENQVAVDNIWTYPFIFTKQNTNQIAELCKRINSYFELAIEIESVDWRKIDQLVNQNIKKMDMGEVLDRINPEARGFMILDQFSNIHDRVRCKCLNCGDVWETSITNILYSNRGCKKCTFKTINSDKRRAVNKLDVDGNILQKYESIADASRDSGIPTSKICSVCKGTRKSAGGFKWEYV